MVDGRALTLPVRRGAEDVAASLPGMSHIAAYDGQSERTWWFTAPGREHACLTLADSGGVVLQPSPLAGSPLPAGRLD